MTLVLSQPPLSEPVTLDEVKAHLRVDHKGENDLLNIYLNIDFAQNILW